MFDPPLPLPKNSKNDPGKADFLTRWVQSPVNSSILPRQSYVTGNPYPCLRTGKRSSEMLTFLQQIVFLPDIMTNWQELYFSEKWHSSFIRFHCLIPNTNLPNPHGNHPK